MTGLGVQTLPEILKKIEKHILMLYILSYYTYSITGKTAILVPEFVVEDLPSAA